LQPIPTEERRGNALRREDRGVVDRQLEVVLSEVVIVEEVSSWRRCGISLRKVVSTAYLDDCNIICVCEEREEINGSLPVSRNFYSEDYIGANLSLNLVKHLRLIEIL
jgi:hypothetical protein